MARFLTPHRRRGVEYLDQSDDAALQRRSHRDIALANSLFGGTRAAFAELEAMLPRGGGEVTLLDVGTGTGDIPERLVRLAARAGVTLRVVGLDGRIELVKATREWPTPGICGDALALPFASASFDCVLASQVVHHFTRVEALHLLREMHRVAKRRVIVSDLRRSWTAAAGLWLVSFPLGFHPVSRHDGVVSILRGFDGPDLAALISDAVGVRPRIRHRFAWRVTASWEPAAATGPLH